MSEQPKQTTPKRRRWPRRVLIVFLVFATLYAAYRYTLHRMVEAKLNEIRKQGYPVTLAELDKWYPQVPAGQNAAEIYLQAFAKFSKWNTNSMIVKRDLLPVVGNAKLPPGSQALSNEEQSLIAEYLTDNAEAVRLLHKAASVRECRYPVVLTDGIAIHLPHLMELRQGARLLSLEGILGSEKGEAEAASAAMLDGLSLASSVKQEPLVISEMVREACQYFALTDLERMLNRTTTTDKRLAQFATAIFDAESSQAMTRGLVGEICLGNSVFTMSARRFTQSVMDGWL